MSNWQEARRAALSRNAENKARMAFSSGTFALSGEGLAEFEDAIEFGLAYLERPFVMTGITLEWDLGDFPDGTLPPHVTGYVFDWEVNEFGHYTGAWCAARIEWGGVVVPEDFEFEIDFTFKGIAMKDVDPEVRA
jgi:hypothetical protein